MIKIEEVIGGNGTVYTRTDEDGTMETISTSCVMKTLNDVDTYVFRDYQMKILIEPSSFVTDELQWESSNTVSQAVSAMKALSNYCALVRTPFRAFDTAQARNFLMFLRGTLSDGIAYKFKLATQRSEETIAAYLKHIRRYARWAGIGNSPFLQPKRSLIGNTLFETDKDGAHKIQANTVAKMETPRYISPEEYRKILSEIDKNWTIEEKCIVRLMYEHGLRIGEVLGLTIEDLEWSESTDGVPRYAVILRNRKSDSKDQHAKTLMKVSDPAQYRSTDYRKRNHGFQRVYISESLFFALSEYAEGAHAEENEKSLADAVGKDTESNHYLFLNKWGNPLSANLWNKRLRTIMAASGVQTDKEARKTNLNHRFRHGYAMFLTRNATKNGKPLNEFEIMTLMRHRSLNSTQVYYRPTEEDVHQMQEDIISELEEKIYAGEE